MLLILRPLPNTAAFRRSPSSAGASLEEDTRRERSQRRRTLTGRLAASNIFRSLGHQKISVCRDLEMGRFFADIVKFNQCVNSYQDDLYKEDA